MPEVEVKVPQQETSAGQQPPAPEKKLPAKKRSPRKTRNMIIALVVVAALAVGGGLGSVLLDGFEPLKMLAFFAACGLLGKGFYQIDRSLMKR